MKLWKTIPKSFESNGHKWSMNKWFRVDGEIVLCRNGFHASPLIYDAYGYVNPGWICLVEVRGDHQEDTDKSCWREMRILKRWKWTDEMARWWAVFAAELALPVWEKQYPNDKRVKDCIETTKRCLHGKATKDELVAAWAAARAAEAAAGYAGVAAWAAAQAAWAAARAALAAARAAARVAWAAARAALAAAEAAARGAAWYAGAAAGYAWDAAWDAAIEKLEAEIKRLARIKEEK